MKLSRLYITVVIVFLALMCRVPLMASPVGSGKKYFQLAESEYSAKQYLVAIPLYKASIKGGNKEMLVLLRLGDCYWHIRNIDSALHYYNRYVGTNTSAVKPELKLRLAELLAQKGKYGSAIQMLDSVAENSASYNQFIKVRKQGFQHPEKFKEDSLRYNIQYLNINTTYADYSPQYFDKGLVYISNRITEDQTTRAIGWNGNTYARLYQLKNDSLLKAVDTAGSWQQPPYLTEAPMKYNDDDTRPTSNDNDVVPKFKYDYLLSKLKAVPLYPVEPFANLLQTDHNNGPFCFNKQRDVMYFTRNSQKPSKGVYNLEIWKAVLNNGVWGGAKKLSFTKEGFDYFHPCLNADDNRLYFCSNQLGGKGGSDIYSMSISNSASDFSEDITNESIINTVGNELFPAFHGDTLYFSSDGYAGLGGLDIYRWRREKGVLLREPENIGYPVNSSYDDFGMIHAPNGYEGLFTSNRLGSDDIYSFKKNLNTISRPVTDSSAQMAKRKSEADSLARKQQEELARAKQPKKLTLKEVENLLKTQHLDEADKKVQNEVDMLAKLVLFETAKDILLPKSIVILEAVKAFMYKYPAYMLMIEGHTDNRASQEYNIILSNKRAAAVRKYLVAHGITAERLFSAGYGFTIPKATNGTPEGRQQNRRVEMRIVKQF